MEQGSLLDRVVRTRSDIGSCRDVVLDLLLDNGIADDTAFDVQLACSELVTNGLMHAEAIEVAVELRIEPGSVTLAVSYPDTGVMAGATVSMSDTGQASGRGLAIVVALASTFTSTMTDQWRTLMVATFDL